MYKIGLFLSSSIKQFLIPFMVIVLVVGCNKTLDSDFLNFGYEYYPTEVGDFRVYHTTAVRYNLNGTIDTTKYLVKEVVEELTTYSDNSNRFILGRYSADIGSDVWKKDSIWAVLNDASKVVLSEANKDFIKLVYPVIEEIEWDGNAFNNDDEEFYKIENLGQPYIFDTISYDNTLTVIHEDLIDPVKITEDRYRMEVFAADVGLIYKLKIKINYCSTCIENGKIEDGYVFEQKLIEFGKE